MTNKHSLREQLASILKGIDSADTASIDTALDHILAALLKPTNDMDSAGRECMMCNVCSWTESYEAALKKAFE